MTTRQYIQIFLFLALILLGLFGLYHLSDTTSQKAKIHIVNSPSSSKSSREYAIMGRQAWAAFSCSILSIYTKKPKESDRLFLYGYNRAKIFLKALRLNKINPVDVNNNVPMGMLWNLYGPNEEFIIGRIYQSVLDSIDQEYDSRFREFLHSGASGDYSVIRVERMEKEFRDKNCNLLGI